VATPHTGQRVPVALLVKHLGAGGVSILISFKMSPRQDYRHFCVSPMQPLSLAYLAHFKKTMYAPHGLEYCISSTNVQQMTYEIELKFIITVYLLDGPFVEAFL